MWISVAIMSRSGGGLRLGRARQGRGVVEGQAKEVLEGEERVVKNFEAKMCLILR